MWGNQETDMFTYFENYLMREEMPRLRRAASAELDRRSLELDRSLSDTEEFTILCKMSKEFSGRLPSLWKDSEKHWQASFAGAIDMPADSARSRLTRSVSDMGQPLATGQQTGDRVPKVHDADLVSLACDKFDDFFHQCDDPNELGDLMFDNLAEFSVEGEQQTEPRPDLLTTSDMRLSNPPTSSREFRWP